MKINKKIAVVLSAMMVSGAIVGCSANGQVKSSTDVKSSSVESSEYITEEKAKEIMLAKVEGAEIVEFELDEYDDDKDDIVEYEAELEKDGEKYDISVDATTGEVLDFEKDDVDDSIDDIDDQDDQDDDDDK